MTLDSSMPVATSQATPLRGFPPLKEVARQSRQQSTTVASSRETLSAIAHGGNPQDRVASPRHCLL
jgi:hypothetical protein